MRVQSLSYLRIQVTRLEKCIEQGCDARAIAEELKNWLAGARSAGVKIAVDVLQSVTVRVSDDVRGFDPLRTPSGYFGVNIRHDHARILGCRP